MTSRIELAPLVSASASSESPTNGGSSPSSSTGNVKSQQSNCFYNMKSRRIQATVGLMAFALFSILSVIILFLHNWRAAPDSVTDVTKWHFHDQNLQGHTSMNSNAKFGDKCGMKGNVDFGGGALDASVSSLVGDAQRNSPNYDPHVWEMAIQSMEVGFRRFEAVTGSTGIYTSSQCIQTSLSCRTGNYNPWQPREYKNCWCMRIDLATGVVSYLSKKGLYKNEQEINDVTQENFSSMQLSFNLLQTAIIHEKFKGAQSTLPTEGVIYLVLNTWDEPNLWVPTDNADDLIRLPRIAPMHPGHDVFDWRIPKLMSFEGSFGPPEHVLGANVCQQFPVLGWSVNPLHNFDILMPHRHCNDCDKRLLDPAIANVKWEDKDRKLSFHGNIGTCDIKDPVRQRERLCWLVNGKFKRKIESQYHIEIDYSPNKASPTQQVHSKFIILLDGVVAAFRSTWYLASGSVILASGLHVDYRTAMMVPYVHYIPFSATDEEFDGFLDALALVAENDAYARWIGENSRRLAKTISSNANGEFDGGAYWDKVYLGMVVQQYANRYKFEEDHNRSKYKFTTRRSNCPDKVEGLAFNHCFNRTYACTNKWQDGFLANPDVKFIDFPALPTTATTSSNGPP